ncbi:hypothetical protein G9A89_023097 [Geosiphon pyriformis]|nr:hypothetical protein G9A89_023097 [Geosiphon pyriformis]
MLWMSKIKKKWDNKLCLACGGTCDKLCQYTILISDWVRKKTPIDAIWRQAIKHLDGCPYDDDKIWQMTLAKIKGVIPKEIKTIKDNSPEFIELD